MRGYIRERNGAWELFVDLGQDALGRRQRRTRTVRGTRREADAELRRMLSEHDRGLRVDPAKIQLADHLRTWLANKPDLEPGTREKYHQIVEDHLVPAFGALSLAALRPDTIRAAYMKWVVSGRRDGPGGLSPATIRKIHTVIRQALQTAFEDGFVSRNVAAGLRLPKGELRQKRALDKEEVGALVHAARRPNLHSALIVMIATGLRRGELLGLTWSDIDLKAATMCVRRSVEKTQAGLRLKKPKTNRSRVIAIPSVACEVLRTHRIDQQEQRLRIGSLWTDLDLVFPGAMAGCRIPQFFRAQSDAQQLAQVSGPSVRMRCDTPQRPK